MSSPELDKVKSKLALRNRTVLICDDIDNISVMEAIYYLTTITDIDKKFDKELEPIHIHVNTNGGYVEDGLILISFIEMLKESGYQVITTNIGKAYSMGFFIAICGSVRKSYRYARYMYHDMTYGAIGQHQDILDTVEECERMRDVMKGICNKYTKTDLSYFEELDRMKKDKFLSPQDMLEIKGVDLIV